ncbi:hypothetical protein NMY22_g4354 [Coprinellus aureogranulatus]|nr:hypothetical protein NMY22_g4354 [Coprinellus aureogranulatus]
MLLHETRWNAQVTLVSALALLSVPTPVLCLPQSSGSSDVESSVFGNSSQLAEEAKKAGLPEASIQACMTCNTALDAILPCAQGDAQCLCGDGLPERFQTCAQCLVDVGPQTAGLSEEEWAGAMADYNRGCNAAGYPNNVTADVTPTPGSPAAKENVGSTDLAFRKARTIEGIYSERYDIEIQ